MVWSYFSYSLVLSMVTKIFKLAFYFVLSQYWKYLSFQKIAHYIWFLNVLAQSYSEYLLQ